MENKKLIQQGVDYIEENLRGEINAAELAKNAGFSLWHYYRLFVDATGFPVMQFILRRKLLHAVHQISRGISGIDAALEYGFDTYAGFYKAFRREFGMTPSAFIKEGRAKPPRKINLLMEEHMEISKKKAAETLKNWQLNDSEITDIYYEGTNNRNENACYVGSGYVLKYTSNPGRMKAAIALSKAMEEAGLVCAAVVPTSDGQDFVQDGDVYFFLSRRLPGRQMSSAAMMQAPDNEQARMLGELLGHLHQALAKMDAPVDEPDFLQNLTGWAIPETVRILGLSDSFARELTDSLQRNLPQLPRQIIHRDPNPGNIIGQGGQYGFIDFELAEKNIRILDPVYASTAILSECYDPARPEVCEKWLELYHSIAEGYDSVASMAQAEMQAYPCVLLANQMICVAWFAGQEKYPEAFERNKGMTQWLVEHMEQLKLD